MVSLFPLFLLFITLAAALGSRNNNQKKQSTGKPMATGGTKSASEDAATLEARRRHLQELEDKRQQLRASKQAQQRAQAAPAVAARERMQHISVTPHTDDIFSGSMNYQTTEGEDPCHEEELEPMVNPCELAPRAGTMETPAKARFSFEWTGDAMVKAVVMQEILTRPCDRPRR